MEIPKEIKKVIPNTLFLELQKVREDIQKETKKKTLEWWRDLMIQGGYDVEGMISLIEAQIKGLDK